MAKTAIKPVYKAKDDSEHDTPQEATAQNKRLEAFDALKEAVEGVERVLKKEALTADGESFVEHHDFWWLQPNYCSGLPSLHRVVIYPWHCEIDQDLRHNGALVVIKREMQGNRFETVLYPVCELYADRRKAEAAHVAACEERLKELAEQVDAIRKQYAK